MVEKLIECKRCGSNEFYIIDINSMQKVICKNCDSFIGVVEDAEGKEGTE